MPTAPTPAQISNRQLAATGAAPTAAPASAAPYNGSGTSTTSDYNDQAASELNNYLNGGTVTPAESSYENTLLGQYDANTKATESAYQNEYSGMQQNYQAQLDQLNREIGNNTNTDAENNMGVNASLTAYDKNLGASQDAQLLGSEAQAEGANATAQANALSGLSENYQTNLQTGRSTMASQLNNAATLQTPEEKNQLTLQANQQQATMQLAQLAPDSGISSNDTYDQAIAKFRNSTYYKNNIGQSEATIQQLQAQAQAASASAGASSAQAGASSASAAQTRTLTGLMTSGGGNDQTYIDALKSGSLTEAGLSTAINSSIDPQGVKRILSEAMSQGYNPNAGNASAAASEANASSLGGGGFGGAINPGHGI
jgi:hypothetical protein